MFIPSTEVSRQEIINTTAEYIAKLIDEGVFKFSFVPPAKNLVPMVSDCLRSHDDGAFDPIVIAIFDTIETQLKLSVYWISGCVVVGSCRMPHDNTLENKQRAKMWATMTHIHNFKSTLLGVS
jgi:hypothetical protein